MITDGTPDNVIKELLTQPGNKVLSKVIRNIKHEIVGYAWVCDKHDCNCEGHWYESFEQ